jgi:transcriptional accessory protein Tex/SPT6
MRACCSAARILNDHGIVESKVVEGKEDAGEKFTDYFDYSKPCTPFLRTARWHCSVAAVKKC